MKQLILFLSVFLYFESTKAQSFSITQLGKVSFVNSQDQKTNEMRMRVAATCNRLIKKKYSKISISIYLIFVDTLTKGKVNVYIDNLFGNSLDRSNSERSLKFYKPGLRICAIYNEAVAAKLLTYGLKYYHRLYTKRAELIKIQSEDKEKLMLDKDEIANILK